MLGTARPVTDLLGLLGQSGRLGPSAITRDPAFKCVRGPHRGLVVVLKSSLGGGSLLRGDVTLPNGRLAAMTFPARLWGGRFGRYPNFY